MADGEFSETRVEEALAAARRFSDEKRRDRGSDTISLEDGGLKMRAECISLTIANGQACLKLPLGLGDLCLPVPSWIPDGTVAQACIDICTKWGVPCGVEVTVSVAGNQIVGKHIGCSC